tara:strand:- start:1235 stop:2065 length:831 start_codon:yes stop_codon:yes gene_type:complete
MDKIVLYCKSYRNDVHRLKVLLDSVIKYNRDGLKFYISCPEIDVDIFKQVLGNDGYELLTDEQIVSKLDIHGNKLSYINQNFGWVQQQVVKSEFWKLDLCVNYLCLDSDMYFITDFYEHDFIYEGDTPYTVMHECKDLLQFTSRNNMGFVRDSFVEDRKYVQNIFNRKGKPYDFGPTPVIWSRKVWESLKKDYLDPNGLTFLNLIEAKHCEFHWYGEWLLKKRPIDILPIDQIFKNYHYREQYEESIKLGDTEKTLSENFLGVALETTWGAPLKYE